MVGFSAVETIPIAKDADGVTRVSGTRVTLDSLVEASQQGATPEEISQQFSSVPLGDVYEVIGYYLRHTSEFDHYFHERAEAARLIKAENERRRPGADLRDRLLARRASPGHTAQPDCAAIQSS